MDKEDKKLLLELGYASSLGIAMAIAIFGSILIGAYIDRKLGTGTKFSAIFLLVGVIAGFRTFYVFIKRYLPDKDVKPERRNMANGPGNKNHPAKKN
jgi:ATP synthase protein I